MKIKIVIKHRKTDRAILRVLALMTAIICLTVMVENPPKNWQAITGKTIFEIVEKRMVTVTAYSSTRDQTDSTPFITASNTRVRDGIIACNFLPFGTKVLIPEEFGCNKIFTVEDRMARRHKTRVDIWFKTRKAAKQFGIKELEIIVLTN